MKSGLVGGVNLFNPHFYLQLTKSLLNTVIWITLVLRPSKLKLKLPHVVTIYMHNISYVCNNGLLVDVKVSALCYICSKTADDDDIKTSG